MSYRSSSAVGTLCSPASPGTVLSGGSCAGCHDVDDPPEGKKRVGLVVARYVGCIESRAWVTNCDVSSKSLRHSFTTNEYGCGDADVSPFGDDHAGRGVPSIYRYGSDSDVEESRDSECWKVSCRQIEGRLVIDGETLAPRGDPCQRTSEAVHDRVTGRPNAGKRILRCIEQRRLLIIDGECDGGESCCVSRVSSGTKKAKQDVLRRWRRRSPQESVSHGESPSTASRCLPPLSAGKGT